MKHVLKTKEGDSVVLTLSCVSCGGTGHIQHDGDHCLKCAGKGCLVTEVGNQLLDFVELFGTASQAGENE